MIHSYRKLFANGFLSGVAPVVIHDGRKLFANGFLSGVAPMAFHSSRKLFVDSFSVDMKLMHSIAAGNYLQMVSYPAWGPCDS